MFGILKKLFLSAVQTETKNIEPHSTPNINPKPKICCKYFENPQLFAMTDNEGNYKFNNVPNLIPLEKQFLEIHPELSEEEVGRCITKISQIFTDSTPSICSWQDIDWPVDNADYCVFICIAGKADLNRLAKDGNGKKLFIENILKSDIGNKEVYWNALKDGQIVENGIVDMTHQANALVFQSLHTSKYTILFDAL